MLATFTETSPMSVSDTVVVQTQFKGPLEVPANKILRFTTPLLGFDHLDRFLLYQTQDGPLFWLQAVDDPKVSFCLLAPFQTGMEIDMEISSADAIDIGARDVTEIEVFTIMVLDKDPAQIRTNLRAPLLICPRTGLGKQLVLSNTNLPIQFHLRELKLPGRPRA